MTPRLQCCRRRSCVFSPKLGAFGARSRPELGRRRALCALSGSRIGNDRTVANNRHKINRSSSLSSFSFSSDYPTRTALEKGKGNLFIATITKRKEILNNKLYKPSKIVKSVVKDLPELIAPPASIYQR